MAEGKGYWLLFV